MRDARKKARSAERLYRKHPSCERSKEAFRHAENQYLRIMDKNKTEYYQNIIKDNAHDQGRL